MKRMRSMMVSWRWRWRWRWGIMPMAVADVNMIHGEMAMVALLSLNCSALLRLISDAVAQDRGTEPNLCPSDRWAMVGPSPSPSPFSITITTQGLSPTHRHRHLHLHLHLHLHFHPSPWPSITTTILSPSLTDQLASPLHADTRFSVSPELQGICEDE